MDRHTITKILLDMERCQGALTVLTNEGFDRAGNITFADSIWAVRDEEAYRKNVEREFEYKRKRGLIR